MAAMPIRPEDLTVVAIGPVASSDIAAFGAGDDIFGQELTAYLQERALTEHSLRLGFTELFYVGDELVAYVTTSAAGIRNRMHADAPAQIQGIRYPDVPTCFLGAGPSLSTTTAEAWGTYSLTG